MKKAINVSVKEYIIEVEHKPGTQIITSTGMSFNYELSLASKNKTIGEFIEWLIINKPNVKIEGINLNSGHKDIPLCLVLNGRWD